MEASAHRAGIIIGHGHRYTQTGTPFIFFMVELNDQADAVFVRLYATERAMPHTLRTLRMSLGIRLEPGQEERFNDPDPFHIIGDKVMLEAKEEVWNGTKRTSWRFAWGVPPMAKNTEKSTKMLIDAMERREALTSKPIPKPKPVIVEGDDDLPF